ncbi:DUF4392 domain-containing protein [bacterium]|nr:DUF4392 domain-containing protein [bacterium]
MNTSFSALQKMRRIAETIESIIHQDPGNRGLNKWAVKGDLLLSALELLKGNHIVIGTGFYILTSGVIETDGPPGAIVLASALRSLNKKISLVVDDHSESIMKEGLKALDCDAELILLPVDKPVKAAAVLTDATTHFVALERPGKAKDGNCYNFRGEDISLHVASLDDVFIHAAENGIRTIGIGDGGNEIGMGRVATDVEKHVAPGRPFACVTKADLCICAGVSNWAGYGLAAMLSRITGKNLMAESSKLIKLVEAIVEAGAVDGVTGKNEPTVDGLAFSWEQKTYSEMFGFAEKSML